jgi:hypothetical protein
MSVEKPSTPTTLLKSAPSSYGFLDELEEHDAKMQATTRKRDLTANAEPILKDPITYAVGPKPRGVSTVQLRLNGENFTVWKCSISSAQSADQYSLEVAMGTLPCPSKEQPNTPERKEQYQKSSSWESCS